MRTLKNVDIDYEEGRLTMRPGYVRWNSVALPAVADQLFDFVDLSGNQHLIGICNSRWYEFKETGAHVMLVDEAATAPRPIFAVQDRLFLGTDTALYWTDDTVIASADRVYTVGIDPPSEPPMVARHAALGNTAGLVNPAMSLNIAYAFTLDNQFAQKIAANFTLTEEVQIRDISLNATSNYWWYTQTGAVRIRIVEQSGGEPSDTLVDPSAVTAWKQVSAWSDTAYEYQVLSLPERITVAPGDYSIIVEPDSAYNDSADLGYMIALNWNNQLGGFEWNTDPHFVLGWLPATDPLAPANPRKPGFYFGGLDTTKIYGYAYTFYNSTYRSESRKSDEATVQPTTGNPNITVNYLLPTDGQVDTVRVYRRSWDQALGYEPDEAQITDVYKLVGEATGPPWTTYVDTLADESRGALLDSDDHYGLQHTDESDEGLRDEAVIPSAGCYWNDRVWVTDGSNNVWMSKIFEVDNAAGLVNDPTEDYFPLRNKLNTPVSSGIIALEPMSDDQLIVYFRDESVRMIWGAYEPLNPPSDLNFGDVLARGGLLAPRGVDRTSTRHAIMTSDGLWAFSGSGGMPELLSETNQSIFKAIESSYLENTRVVVFGTEIWVLHDPDNDGDLEEILILDMMRDVPSRQRYDRAWRTYGYDVPLRDIVVRRTGADYKHILAADGTNAYILRLGTGTTDNGSAIIAAIETHNIQARNLVMLSGIELDGSYPETAPTYRIYGYASDGSVKTYDLTPTSDVDIRRHRTGMQVLAVGDARIKIEMTSTQADQLKAFLVKYVTE